MSKKLIPLLAKSALGLAGLFVLSMIAGFVAGYVGGKDDIADDPSVLWIVGVFAVVTMAGAIWVGAAWMKSIDEAAQEAHKASWYWGGSTGLAIGGVGIILATLPHAETYAIGPIQGRTDPLIYMAAGAMGIMMLMLIGYIIVWAWWWLARR